jgi:hypothetical protein
MLRIKACLTMGLIIFLCSVFLTASRQPSYAATGLEQSCKGPAASSPVCTEADSTTGNPLVGADGIITRVIQLIVLITGIAAVIVIIIAGLRYITSSGDATKVESAKNAILFAVIGIVIAVMAQAIVTFVLSKL